jgi:hypothetical protein
MSPPRKSVTIRMAALSLNLAETKNSFGPEGAKRIANAQIDI